MKKLAILTSGGDAPGMNAAIRAIVRIAFCKGVQTFGILRGYSGLLENHFIELGPRSVSNIIQRGGTILKSSRSSEFKTREGLKKAAAHLDAEGFNSLITIGGNGTSRGAYELSKIWKGQIIGITSTIDNDVYGTDQTIGYDSAVNTALQAIDKIRDTADSHERFFLIEVMGRDAGFIGLQAGIAGGVEEIMIPETKMTVKDIHKRLCAGRDKGKNSTIMVVSEGDEEGRAVDIAHKLKALSPVDYKVVVLGHTQRGGSPTAADRLLATELGAFAVEQLIKGKSGVAVGKSKGRLVLIPLKDTWSKKKSLDPFLLKLLPLLSS